MLNAANRQRRRSLGRLLVLFGSAIFVALPWLGYRYFDEMKTFILHGQREAQMLSARAIASLLYDRADLLSADFATTATDRHNRLYVYPLDRHPAIDGYESDWRDAIAGFDDLLVGAGATQAGDDDLSLRFLLGHHDEHLYGLLQVTDRRIVYRHPGLSRIDGSDQIRLRFLDRQNRLRHYVLLAEAPGRLNAYAMDSDGKTLLHGRPEPALFATWRESAKGYNVEFRLPEKWLAKQPRFGLQVIDVDDAQTRNIEATATSPATGLADGKATALAADLHPLIFPSAELARIIQRLGYDDANLCIIDPFYRVVMASYRNRGDTGFCPLTSHVDRQRFAAAFAGNGRVEDRQRNDQTWLIASQPIFAGNRVIGVVVIEKSRATILAGQHQALLRIIGATAIAFAIAIAGLLIFSSLLAHRIRKLQGDIAQTIDHRGRPVGTFTLSDHDAHDEIGDLSRAFSALLQQLHTYTRFLERMPRVLRHEILNPVNTISMTLQTRDDTKDRPFARAERAIGQLQLIVSSLTEAAHIDEALTRDEKNPVDLASLLSEYCDNIGRTPGDRSVAYRGPDSGVTVMANDARLIQALDKLVGNAADFSDGKTPIRLALKRQDAGFVGIEICNTGPAIDEDIIDQLGRNMLSLRPGADTTPHLGIGLYVCRRIILDHGGQLTIRNRSNPGGVCVSLSLPVAARPGLAI